MPLYIREMKLPDLDEVLVIEDYSFPTPWPRNVYENDLLRNPNSRFFVALDGDECGELLGYIGSWVVHDECHVGTIATRRDARNRGIAEALLVHTARAVIAEGVQYLILEVRVNNFPAINLYKKLGFVQVGLRRGYYRDTGEDALLLAMNDLPALAAREVSAVPAGEKTPDAV